ncbi:MAG: hypothetical protein COA45_03075 [Zetaproteobacteria bacterium]|nr:MAG: hypothetical protein COA45_03075 [Zetaproteobacteria bacterium]
MHMVVFKNTLLLFVTIPLILILGGCQTTDTHDYIVQKGDSASLNRSGIENLNTQNYEKAAKSFKKSLELDPENYEARFGLAESQIKLQEYEQALMNFQMLVPVPAYKAISLQEIGLLELRRRNFDVAQEYLELALESDRNLWRTWNGLAQINAYQYNWEATDRFYENALDTAAGQQHVIYNNMGVSYLARGNKEDAIVAFNSALNYAPELDIVKTNYKLALATLSRYDEATIESDVHSRAKALNNVGYAAMLQGDYEEAERLLLKSIEVSPNFYKTPYRNLQILHQLMHDE